MANWIACTNCLQLKMFDSYLVSVITYVCVTSSRKCSQQHWQNQNLYLILKIVVRMHVIYIQS